MNGSWTWRRVLRWAAISAIVEYVVVLATSGEVIPPLIVIGALLGIGAWLARRPGKVGPILLLVVFLVFLASNLAFAGRDLGEWRSFPSFAVAAASIVTAVVGLFAAVVALRGERPSAAPRATALGSAALVLVLLVANGVGTATYDEPARGATDVAIVAKDITWDRATLTAPAGRVTFYADNRDAVLHNLHVKGVGTISMPASKAAAGTFEVKAGTYDYVCDLHLDMKGVLTVT